MTRETYNSHQPTNSRRQYNQLQHKTRESNKTGNNTIHNAITLTTGAEEKVMQKSLLQHQSTKTKKIAAFKLQTNILQFLLNKPTKNLQTKTTPHQ